MSDADAGARPKLKFGDHLECIAVAGSPDKLETAFQAALRAYPSSRTRERLTRAVSRRGDALAVTSGAWSLMPRIGPRRRMTLGANTYRIGYGQNGAGERYVWCYADQWVDKQLKARQVPASVRRHVIAWYSSRYPHRALAALERYMRFGGRR